MSDWEDITSYRRGRKGEDEPRTYRLQLGEAYTLTVTRLPRRADEWFWGSRAFGFWHPLNEPDLHKAKRKALERMTARLEKRERAVREARERCEELLKKDEETS